MSKFKKGDQSKFFMSIAFQLHSIREQLAAVAEQGQACESMKVQLHHAQGEWNYRPVVQKYIKNYFRMLLKAHR